MESDEQTQPELKASPTTHKQSDTPENDQYDAKPYHVILGSTRSKRTCSLREEVLKREDDEKIIGKLAYTNAYAPGYRFMPTDEELIVCYLQKKVMNEPMAYNKIQEVNLYHHNPEDLAEAYEHFGEKEWFFFTPRDRKYRNGSRPNRAAGNGYWKATGADRPVTYNGETVGFRKALVFYEGKPPKGDKSNWIMHEFRVNQPVPKRRSSDDMRLDDWVLCRIYKKDDKHPKNRRGVGYRDAIDSHSDVSEDSTPAVDVEIHDNPIIEHSLELVPRFGDSCIAPPAFRNVVPHDVPLLVNSSSSLTSAKYSFDDFYHQYGGASPIYPPAFPPENVFCIGTLPDNFNLPGALHFDYCSNLIDTNMNFDNIFPHDGATSEIPSENQLIPRKRSRSG